MRFGGQRAGEEIPCAISEEALMDHYGSAGLGERELLRAFRAHREEIQARAHQKYRAREQEPDGSILIRTIELTEPKKRIRHPAQSEFIRTSQDSP